MQESTKELFRTKTPMLMWHLNCKKTAQQKQEYVFVI